MPSAAFVPLDANKLTKAAACLCVVVVRSVPFRFDAIFFYFHFSRFNFFGFYLLSRLPVPPVFSLRAFDFHSILFCFVLSVRYIFFSWTGCSLHVLHFLCLCTMDGTTKYGLNASECGMELAVMWCEWDALLWVGIHHINQWHSSAM